MAKDNIKWGILVGKDQKNWNCKHCGATYTFPNNIDYELIVKHLFLDIEKIQHVLLQLQEELNNKCVECEKIDKDEAYQHVLDNPPNRGP